MEKERNLGVTEARFALTLLTCLLVVVIENPHVALLSSKNCSHSLMLRANATLKAKKRCRCTGWRKQIKIKSSRCEHVHGSMWANANRKKHNKT